MSERRSPANSNDVPNEGTSDDELIKIRRIIIGPEQARLADLQERLDNPRLLAKDISRALPEAVILRSSQDNQFATALTPTLEEVIRSSIKKDPKALVSALFPVMGPAIRKAITETLRSMLQSLNQALEKSVSVEGLKWRLEAMRTGKPFAEVVLLHSLAYRVEQVFLIHRETGLLLQHVVEAEIAFQDADMVSGMLTAIQDFIRDSFGVDNESEIETIQIGNFTVWVIQGPDLVLAAVIRGTAPEELKTVFQETLENIHLEQGRALESFSGDTTPFEGSRHHLEACLVTRYKEEKKKVSPFLWIIPAALIFGIGVWAFFSVRSQMIWTDYLEKVRCERGIVVTETGTRDGNYFIAGFRDPLAVDPLAILRESKLDPEKVSSRWESYYSLHPEFVMVRAKKILKPPETVSLELHDAILQVSGSAPHRWIEEARALARGIPGITELKEKNLADTDLERLSACRKRIEQQELFFTRGNTGLAEDQGERVNTLARHIRQLQDLARLLGKDLTVVITGHTDRSGSEEHNLILSRERADFVRSLLVAEGLQTVRFQTAGAGSRESLSHVETEHDSELSRKVSFTIILNDTPPSKGNES